METEHWRRQEWLVQINQPCHDVLRVSAEILQDDWDALCAIFYERKATAAATAIVAAKAPLTKGYLAAALIPASGNVAAATKCLG